MTTYNDQSYWAKIYVAGPIDQIEQVCREYVVKGLCVNIKANKYIYKYGEETGAEIELINYPKYPEGSGFIWHDACELADRIMERIQCGSYTIMDSDHVMTFDRRV